MISTKKVSPKISSLSTLITTLNDENFEVVEDPDSIQISQAELAPYIFWSASHYTRNCIARSDHFELILLCWEEGQKAPIHCHNEQECWVKIIEGSFVESVYTLNEATGDAVLQYSDVVSENEVTAMRDVNLLHSLENNSKGRAISLHLYVKPIVQCRVYNERTNQMEVRQLSYNSFEGKLL